MSNLMLGKSVGSVIDLPHVYVLSSGDWSRIVIAAYY